MVLVPHGIYKFPGTTTTSDAQMCKWLRKAHLAIEFLRPTRNRRLHLADKARAEAIAKLETLRKSMPKQTISAAETAALVNEDRIELLQDLTKDTAVSLDEREIFKAKPSKLLDILKQRHRMGKDTCDLLNVPQGHRNFVEPSFPFRLQVFRQSLIFPYYPAPPLVHFTHIRTCLKFNRLPPMAIRIDRGKSIIGCVVFLADLACSRIPSPCGQSHNEWHRGPLHIHPHRSADGRRHQCPPSYARTSL